MGKIRIYRDICGTDIYGNVVTVPGGTITKIISESKYYFETVWGRVFKSEAARIWE